MLRCMYSGISGLKVNQTKLDVVGNNIANVGTTAFKSQRIRFADTLSQKLRDATAPDRNGGGTNPMQIGLGVQVAGVDTVMTAGNLQPTSRPLDVAIDGEGFFLVGRGALPNSNVEGATFEKTYTRDGSFTLDQAGNLLTSDGARVLGYSLKVTGQGNYSTQYDGGRLDKVTYINASDSSLKAEGELVPLVIPDKVAREASNFGGGTNLTIVKGKHDETKLDAATGIYSDEPKITGTYGEAGGIKPTKAMNIKIRVVKDSAKPGGFKQEVSVNGYGWKDDFRAAAKAAGIDDTDKAAKVDTMFGLTLVLGTADATTEGNIWETNVYPAGEDIKIKSFSIDKDGLVKAVLEDGSVAALGQIGMANFKNPAGLEKLGKNLYKETANSGSAELRSKKGAVNPNDAAYGDMVQGCLEMSNVDLAEQFTDMIVASRAFQANGKIISTGDEILQELVNLKR